MVQGPDNVKHASVQVVADALSVMLLWDAFVLNIISFRHADAVCRLKSKAIHSFIAVAIKPCGVCAGNATQLQLLPEAMHGKAVEYTVTPYRLKHNVAQIGRTYTAVILQPTGCSNIGLLICIVWTEDVMKMIA